MRSRLRHATSSSPTKESAEQRRSVPAFRKQWPHSKQETRSSSFASTVSHDLSGIVTDAQSLQERGVYLRSLSDAIDTSTASGRFTYHVLGAVAQFERDLIVERTREALRAKSRRGERLGRRRALTPQQVERARRHVERGEAVSDIARDLKVSRRTLHRALAAQRLVDAA